ncbi:uncharacterized protein TNCV_1389321 [Trichonephila clavipes]|nr:uncharacterized protein TNCV_1389321 [Trichonephila clavipes]
MPLNKCRIGPLAGAPPDTLVISTETESGFITEDDTSPICHTPRPEVGKNPVDTAYDVGSVWCSRSCSQLLQGQYLDPDRQQKLHPIFEGTDLDILSKLVRLGQRKQVCLQWIPSYVGMPGNKAADELAGRGCDLPNPNSTVLTHTEIHSFQRNKMNLTWRNPPADHWYAGKSPGLSIQCRSSRAHQTALARLRSGHLRSMTFVQGVKSFFTCPCSLFASPAYLLDCWVISLRQL